MNVKAVLEFDSATVADKLVRYTGENFDGFEIHVVKRGGEDRRDDRSLRSTTQAGRRAHTTQDTRRSRR